MRLSLFSEDPVWVVEMCLLCVLGQNTVNIICIIHFKELIILALDWEPLQKYCNPSLLPSSVLVSLET